MKRAVTLAQEVEEAAEAHTNLSMFAAIVALCESGCFPGADGHIAQMRIIQICQNEEQRFLRKYDRTVARIERMVPRPAGRAALEGK